MRNAIALLLTLFFLILFSVAITVALKNYKQAQYITQKEQLLLQGNTFLQDILNLLATSSQIQTFLHDKDVDALFAYLQNFQTFPISGENINGVISLASARGKININSLVKNNHVDKKKQEIFLEYFIKNGISEEFFWYLVDSMSGVKSDYSYKSDLFDNHPRLFRDYIASSKHLQLIQEAFEEKQNVYPFSKLPFDTIFFYTNQRDAPSDVNYFSADVWQFVLGCSLERAKELASHQEAYKKLEDIGLNTQEQERLERFKISFFVPVLFVEINLEDGDNNTLVIQFEYDLEQKKGTNFVYIF